MYSEVIYTFVPPSVPEGDRFQCHEAESENPQTFNFTFCETSTTCFNSLRYIQHHMSMII